MQIQNVLRKCIKLLRISSFVKSYEVCNHVIIGSLRSIVISMPQHVTTGIQMTSCPVSAQYQFQCQSIAGGSGNNPSKAPLDYTTLPPHASWANANCQSLYTSE